MKQLLLRSHWGFITRSDSTLFQHHVVGLKVRQTKKTTTSDKKTKQIKKQNSCVWQIPTPALQGRFVVSRAALQRESGATLVFHQHPVLALFLCLCMCECACACVCIHLVRGVNSGELEYLIRLSPGWGWIRVAGVHRQDRQPVLSTSASLHHLSVFVIQQRASGRACVFACTARTSERRRQWAFVCVFARASSSVCLFKWATWPWRSLRDVTATCKHQEAGSFTLSNSTFTQVFFFFLNQVFVTFTAKWTPVPENPNDMVNCLCHPYIRAITLPHTCAPTLSVQVCQCTHSFSFFLSFFCYPC